MNKALALLSILQSINVWSMDKNITPGTLPLGPFDVNPFLYFSESHNDNIFNNNLNRKSSLITRIGAGGDLVLRRKLDRYALHYAFLSSQFHSSQADNYVDQNLGVDAHFDFTKRHRLDFNTNLNLSHLMRGSFFFQGGNGDLETQTVLTIPDENQTVIALPKEPDQFHQYSTNINYRFGRRDAPVNLGLDLGWNQTIYDNHPARTKVRDKTELQFTPSVYWRLGRKTYLIAQNQNSLVNFPNNTNSYFLSRYLLGINWDSFAKLKVAVNAGYYQQEFNNSALNSLSGITWDGHLQWLPSYNSNVAFNFSNKIQPSIIGTSALLHEYDLNWTHNWPIRITTKVSGSYLEIDNQNPTLSNQAVVTKFSFDVKYKMRSWLDFGINYNRLDNQTNNKFFDSTQNIFLFYFNAKP